MPMPSEMLCVQLSHLHTLGAGFLLSQSESVLLCFLSEMHGWGWCFLSIAAGERWDQLSCFQTLVARSSRCPGEGWDQLCTALKHKHGPRWQTRQGTSTWSLAIRDLCCCRYIDPDMAFDGSMSQDLTMALVALPATHFRLFLTHLQLSFSSLCTHPCPFLPSLYHLLAHLS